MGSISGSGTIFAAPIGGWAASIGRAAAAAALFATLGGAMPPASLVVSFDKLRSTKGVIQVCLTADPENFPACVDDKAAIERVVRADAGSLRIGGLAHGGYALAAIHDENNNNKLDTFAGIPKEGIGFSQNPRLGFGPPRFTAARFTVGAQPVNHSVRMKYFL